MNTDRLIKYLKNDLSELTEIFSELKPGSSLSSLEIKMILNRINSVNEEFELLENEINNSSEIETTNQTIQKIPKETVQIKKEPIPHENTVDIKETTDKELTKEEVTIDNFIEESIITEKITDSEVEATAQSIEEELEQIEINEEPQISNEEDDQEIINEEKETNDDPANDQPIEDEPIYDDLAEPQQTIADKYQGSTSSLNEHIAKHIEQKDLASKLQQNPIEDLTKAIKLNDKIWYSNELFEGNLDLYRETIRTINKMDELEEALSFLESNFQFDQTKKSFKSFIEMIYRRFLK